MSNRRKAPRASRRQQPQPAFRADFTPTPGAARSTAFTPAKQQVFIQALAASGCVREAAAAAGIHAATAYRLRAEPAARSFRAAWEHALEFAVSRLAEAVLGRAIHGVSRPIFYKGEQVGERRYYDERLAQFILRARDPVRFGAWRDRYQADRHPEAPALGLTLALNHLDAVNHQQFSGEDPGPPAYPACSVPTDERVDARTQAEIADLKSQVEQLHAFLDEATDENTALEEQLEALRKQPAAPATEPPGEEQKRGTVASQMSHSAAPMPEPAAPIAPSSPAFHPLMGGRDPSPPDPPGRVRLI